MCSRGAREPHAGFTARTVFRGTRVQGQAQGVWHCWLSNLLVVPRPRSRVISRNLKCSPELIRSGTANAAGKAARAVTPGLVATLWQLLLRSGTTRSSVRSVFCQRLSSKWVWRQSCPLNRFRSLRKSLQASSCARFRWKTASRAEFARVFPSSIVAHFLQPESIGGGSRNCEEDFSQCWVQTSDFWERCAPLRALSTRLHHQPNTNY